MYLQTIGNLIAHAIFAINGLGVICHDAPRNHLAKLEVFLGLVPSAQELWENVTQIVQIRQD